MKTMILFLIILGVSAILAACATTRSQGMAPQQITIVKLVKIDKHFNIYKVKEVGYNAAYYMKTRESYKNGDTVMAQPGVDYYYYKWY